MRVAIDCVNIPTGGTLFDGIPITDFAIFFVPPAKTLNMFQPKKRNINYRGRKTALGI